MSAMPTDLKDNQEGQPSLIVELQVDPDKLAQIVSRAPRSDSHAKDDDNPDFTPRSDILRDLSPIRGAIKTPAASLANAPVLNESTKTRASVIQKKGHTLNTTNQAVSIKREHTDDNPNVEGEAQAPPSKRQQTSTRCEGCHTREAAEIGYWIVSTPGLNQYRSDIPLANLCVHKLSRAKVMAEAMLANAQREFTRTAAEFDNLRAQFAAQQATAGPPTSHHRPSQAHPPFVGPQTSANERTAAWLATQNVHQSPPDLWARAILTEAHQFFMRGVPTFPEDELKAILLYVFNTGRTYESGIGVPNGFRDGVSRGKASGFHEGWNTRERYGDIGTHQNLSYHELRRQIMDTCASKDHAIRETDKLGKLIDMLRPTVHG